MDQYSATCPHCSFVLQFYDASLIGRKGRCPKCRNKFILNEPEADEPNTQAARLKPSLPTPPKRPSPAAKSATTKAKAKSPATAAKKPSPRAASKAPANEGQPWETNMNRGLGVRRPTLSPRWVFPNVFAVSSLLATAVGAASGMWAATLLREQCPVSLMAAAAAVGGIIGVAFLVRRYDPLG